MLVAAKSSPELVERAQGGYALRGWSSKSVYAAVTDRTHKLSDLLAGLPEGVSAVEAEQVHGAGIAVVEHASAAAKPIAGCDGLITRQSRIALAVRSADCLPILACDARQGVVGIIHAGWRGLEAQIPMRLVALLMHAYGVNPADLDIAIGPAIRACCYTVGSEFQQRFGPFVSREGERLLCDLAGVAVSQLTASGVPAKRIWDSKRCTSCENRTWFSLRQEGPDTGRLRSVILLR